MHGSASVKGNIPLQDQHLALAILLELAVQRGTLRYASHSSDKTLKVFIWHELWDAKSVLLE